MKPDELYMRSLIREQILKLSTQPTHKCMNGDVVPFGCEECVEDIENRLVDVTFHRDLQDYRTSARDNYNGILRVLRRTLKAAKKQHDKDNPPEAPIAADDEDEVSLVQV